MTENKTNKAPELRKAIMERGYVAPPENYIKRMITYLDKMKTDKINVLWYPDSPFVFVPIKDFMQIKDLIQFLQLNYKQFKSPIRGGLTNYIKSKKIDDAYRGILVKLKYLESKVAKTREYKIIEGEFTDVMIYNIVREYLLFKKGLENKEEETVELPKKEKKPKKKRNDLNVKNGSYPPRYNAIFPDIDEDSVKDIELPNRSRNVLPEKFDLFSSTHWNTKLFLGMLWGHYQGKSYAEIGKTIKRTDRAVGSKMRLLRCMGKWTPEYREAYLKLNIETLNKILEKPKEKSPGPKKEPVQKIQSDSIQEVEEEVKIQEENKEVKNLEKENIDLKKLVKELEKRISHLESLKLEERVSNLERFLIKNSL